MWPTREQLIEVFNDTLRFMEEDFTLSEAVADTNRRTSVYSADFAEEVEARKAGEVRVVKGRTLQTALKLRKEFPSKKIAVLNFAASQRSGGGVKNGSRAQEESLCRSSTLYPSLRTMKARDGFYDYHKNNHGWEASDTCIYSPDVIICKDDSDYIPARLKPEDFVKVDVVTCAAPHIFSNIKISDVKLRLMNLTRAKNIMRVCAYNDADILVTGAFGCGAFKNPPEIVAEAWKEALEIYRAKFDIVVFAVYCAEHESENYRVFHDMLI